MNQNTKRRYLESLSAFFSYAMKRPRCENITGNPAGVVLEEIPKQIRERPDCATWENAKRTVKAIPNPRNEAVVALLAKTGCRLEEALEIEMDDLMLDGGSSDSVSGRAGSRRLCQSTARRSGRFGGSS